MRYIKSVLASDESISADTVTTYDLPTNPLSHIIFTLRCLNVTDEATLAEILARITKIEVLHRGAAIISISGADLFYLNAILFKNMPFLNNQVADDNAHRYIPFIIPFGRKMYDKNEAFPASRKGELQLQITISGTESAVDGVRFQIETVELPEANPSKFIKVTTISKTLVSGSDTDVDLPIGNKLRGILLFSTTIIAAATDTNTIESIKFLLDNIEYNVSKSNWESMRGELISRLGHRAAYDASADNDDLANYALVDFDPTEDDEFIFDTKGASRVVLRLSAGASDAARILPIELVDASNVK